MTYTLFLVLIMIVAFLLILVIMVQNPKGGGLSSSFGGGGTQSLGGVQNTTNFLDKSTWTLSIVLLALILLSNFAAPTQTAVSNSSEIENTIENREGQDLQAPVAEQPASQEEQPAE
ncbi:preprotein translocase subunit SecG [Lutibacter sp. HS1-25]|uniref:preprotein translocase subunit SecG n=1 Tax=Lutibacter sp. HS1-25 TaxID=2485000 RepID=UPI001011C5C8|nr:preprotein translocase subunit SecG [Lutibacter sp. HS1-25]